MSQDRNQRLTYCRSIEANKPAISGQNVPGQESTTYGLSKHRSKQTRDQWTECPRTGINDLRTVEASKQTNPRSVDRMSQDRNQRLTACRSIEASKPAISGQNVPGQESTTYALSKHRSKQTRDQWTECPRTGINDLRSVEASKQANPRSVDRMSQDRNQRLTCCRSIEASKPPISGQNVPGQESTTYVLSKHRSKQTRDQWTECPRTGINDLRPVEASKQTNPRSVDRMSQDRNQRLTICRSIEANKPAISGQNVPGQESTTYVLSKHRSKQTRDQW